MLATIIYFVNMNEGNYCVWAGLWSNTAPVSHSLSSGHRETGRWASAKTRLHPGWKSMARNGRPDFQLVALVDPHRTLSAV